MWTGPLRWVAESKNAIDRGVRVLGMGRSLQVFQSLLLAVWFVQHWHHLELVRNAEYCAAPQTCWITKYFNKMSRRFVYMLNVEDHALVQPSHFRKEGTEFTSQKMIPIF